MKSGRMIYSCKQCGGPVTMHTLGQAPLASLGTWRCKNGCPKRRFQINRFVGCGKETERTRIESVVVRRAIAVKAQRAKEVVCV